MILSVLEGTHYSHTFSLLDDATSDPIDLTNAGLTFKVFKRETTRVGVPAVEQVIMTKTEADDVVITVAGSGLLRIDFVPADTEDLAGVYEWELELIEEDDKVRQAGAGAFHITPRRLDA